VRDWWQRQTLRFRLATWYALGGTLLLSLFSATLYLYVARGVARPLDDQLRQDVATILASLQVSPDRTLLWQGRDLEHADRATMPWFELWDEQGRIVKRRWRLDEGQLARRPAAPSPHRETLSIFNVAPELRLRTLAVPFTGPNGAPWMLRVMRIHEPAAAALHALLLIIVVALPAVVALLVIGGYTLTRRWLQPLDRMVEQARRITAEDLSRRLPVQNPSDELGQLATVFNVTLERLEGSFVALDRFVADASHELRTPLTTLRNVGEVGLRRSRTVEEYRDIIASMLEESERLQVLILRLLELASAGARTVTRKTILIGEYVTACVNEIAVLAEAKNQKILVEAEPCQANTDPVLFRQALQNLLDNAVKYSPPDSTVRVRVRREGGSASRISVADEGSGIPPEFRSRITDRFFRADRGRSRTAGGFGLGLSLTAAYMRVLGGTLHYQPAEPRGSVFTLQLPLESADAKPHS
jgi:heavy metal sensor kinase